MDLRILIPVQPSDQGKSRLASVLSSEARTALNRRFFDHVLGIACAVVPPRQCLVISRSQTLLEAAKAVGAQTALEQGEGLNAALEQGASIARAQGAEAVLSLASDLPLLTANELQMMIAAGETSAVVIAPDSAGSGTNALLMNPPGLIPYRYGEGSFTAHEVAAQAIGASFKVIRQPGLATDIDYPADLTRLL